MTKPSDITKQADGAGGIKWAKDLFEQEIRNQVATKPIDTIKLIRKIWFDAFSEGQRHRESQVIEFLEERIAVKQARSPESEDKDPTLQECQKILKFVKGFSLYHSE